MRVVQARNYIACPFPESLLQQVLYHGTNRRFERFHRPPHGIYVTPLRSWARSRYGVNVLPLYADVRKIYVPKTDAERQPFYDGDYSAVAEFLQRLDKLGYDCCRYGYESDSMVLIGDVPIVHAVSGRPM